MSKPFNINRVEHELKATLISNESLPPIEKVTRGCNVTILLTNFEAVERDRFPQLSCYFSLAADSFFFNQSLIASSKAAVCVNSRRAQAISKAIFNSLGILPRTSLVSSAISTSCLGSGLIVAQPFNKSTFALKSFYAIALLRL